MPQSLWQHIAKEDRQAYAKAYLIYYKRLFNYGRKFTESEIFIEDSIQEVFISLWKYRQRLPTISAPESYLFYSFRNALFHRLKQEHNRNSREKDIEMEPQFSAEAIIIRTEMDSGMRRQLQQALDKLPARQKEAIFLRFYEGLPYDQVAEIMQISVNSTYKVISKALMHLRDQIGTPIGLIILIFSQFWE